MAAALLKCAPEEVETILENAVACTVFEREHRTLPKKVEELDGWKRYKKAGIVVVDAKQTIDPNNPVYVQETV
jgi:hypothetical protein